MLVKNVMDIMDIDIDVLAAVVVPISIPLMVSCSVPWGLGDIVMVEESLFGDS